MIAELLVIAVVIATVTYGAVRLYYLLQKQTTAVDPRGQPKSVALVGGAWILVAFVMGGGALLTLIAGYVMNDIDVPESQPSVRGLSLVQLILAIGSLVAAINFRRLRPWSRPALEAASWLAVLFGVASAVHVVDRFAVPRLTTAAFLVPFCATLVASILYLRSAKIRQLFEPRTEP